MPLPPLPAAFAPSGRVLGVYAAGGVFAAGWWWFFDACVRSHQHSTPPPGADPAWTPEGVAIQFDDWVPGLVATAGLVIVSLIDKHQLMEDEPSWGDDVVLWRSRMWLFIGFACLAGGLAGSMAVLIIKYMINPEAVGFVDLGAAGVVQNVALMACAVLLWFSQRTESDYEYNLTL